MTDLEIFNRLAEIEGAKETFHSISKPTSLTAVFENRTSFGYNPLTDDALCFKLAKKYRVSIDYFEDWQRQGEDKNVLARLEIGFGIYALGTVDFCKNDDSLNKAICLAIIEAHK
jgi:hypothetical protein